MHWPALRTEILDRTARVSALLRALPRGDLPLHRVVWTAAETGAHLVSLPARYRKMVAGPVPVPVSLAHDNQRELAAVPTRDPDALAAQLTSEVDEFLATLGPDGNRPIRYFRAPHTAAGLGGIMLTELLLHGADLARALHKPWPITRTQAVACLRGVLPALVLFADPAAPPGVYHLHLRGGDDWTVAVRGGGVVTVSLGRPAVADVRLSADPVVFLLSGYGLAGVWRVALGGVVAYGRKPWRAGRFGHLFRET